MTLAEFVHVMEGVELRNGRNATAVTPPSLDDFYEDLAAEARAEAGVTRH